MIVGMRIESYNPRTGNNRHTNSCYFTMASKNEDGSLKEVPGLIISNETELIRFCEGKLIRDLSKQKREALKSDLNGMDAEKMKILCEAENCTIVISE
jgi:acyl-CoA hydrolase